MYMNLKLILRTLSQTTLAIALGIIACPDSAQANEDFPQKDAKIAQPTLLIQNSEKAVVLTEKAQNKTSELSETASSIIVASEQINQATEENKPTSININIDSNSPLETQSISIPVAVENNNNKSLNQPVNIPVVPSVSNKVILKQKESNSAVNVDNVDASSLNKKNSVKDNTLVSQQVKTIDPSKQNKKKSSAQEELLSAVPIQIEYYDPSTSPSLENIISPNLPKIDSPEPLLAEESKTFKGYIWPAKGVFTSGYGWRWGRMHKGIDIAAPIGTPIVAAADGKIVSAGWNSGGYGNLVKIKHFDGSISFYAHNSKIMVRNGQWVKQGQQIAKMGSTGFSTGPHLHFEIRVKGTKAVNPVALLPKKR